MYGEDTMKDNLIIFVIMYSVIILFGLFYFYYMISSINEGTVLIRKTCSAEMKLPNGVTEWETEKLTKTKCHTCYYEYNSKLDIYQKQCLAGTLQ